jgi:autotransporter-associated beta strand protein
MTIILRAICICIALVLNVFSATQLPITTSNLSVSSATDYQVASSSDYDINSVTYTLSSSYDTRLYTSDSFNSTFYTIAGKITGSSGSGSYLASYTGKYLRIGEDSSEGINSDDLSSTKYARFLFTNGESDYNCITDLATIQNVSPDSPYYTDTTESPNSYSLVRANVILATNVSSTGTAGSAPTKGPFGKNQINLPLRACLLGVGNDVTLHNDIWLSNEVVSTTVSVATKRIVACETGKKMILHGKIYETESSYKYLKIGYLDTTVTPNITYGGMIILTNPSNSSYQFAPSVDYGVLGVGVVDALGSNSNALQMYNSTSLYGITSQFWLTSPSAVDITLPTPITLYSDNVTFYVDTTKTNKYFQLNRVITGAYDLTIGKPGYAGGLFLSHPSSTYGSGKNTYVKYGTASFDVSGGNITAGPFGASAIRLDEGAALFCSAWGPINNYNDVVLNGDASIFCVNSCTLTFHSSDSTLIGNNKTLIEKAWGYSGNIIHAHASWSDNVTKKTSILAQNTLTAVVTTYGAPGYIAFGPDTDESLNTISIAANKYLNYRDNGNTVRKTGSSTLYLCGSSNISGYLYVNNGTLAISTTTLSGYGQIILASGTTLYGATATVSNDINIPNNSIAITSGSATIQNDSSGGKVLTIPGTISGSGTLTIGASGKTGFVLLTGNNETYTAGISVYSGTTLAVGNKLGSTITLTGSTLKLTGNNIVINGLVSSST